MKRYGGACGHVATFANKLMLYVRGGIKIMAIRIFATNYDRHFTVSGTGCWLLHLLLQERERIERFLSRLYYYYDDNADGDDLIYLTKTPMFSIVIMQYMTFTL